MLALSNGVVRHHRTSKDQGPPSDEVDLLLRDRDYVRVHGVHRAQLREVQQEVRERDATWCR
jgi:hypothetical protein